MIENKKKKSKCSSEDLKKIRFMIWDGVTFFGYDAEKIKRLNGAPPKYSDKVTNIEWVFPHIIAFCLALYLLIIEFNKFGTIVS